MVVVIVLFAIFSFVFLDKNIAIYFHENRIFHKFFSIITNIGDSKYSISISLGLFLLSLWAVKLGYENFERVKKISLLVLSSVIVSGLSVDVVKIIFARYRPPAFFAHNDFGFNWFEFGYLVNSFPSGHSATAFSIFLSLGLIFRKYLNLFLLFAFLVAFSRVAIGVHYLSDVTIGSLIGALSTIYLYKKIYKEEV